MTDQQQPPAPSYPGFEITSAGLEALYSVLGRLTHQALEREARDKASRTTELLEQLQAQQVMAQSETPAAEAAAPLKAKAGG